MRVNIRRIWAQLPDLNLSALTTGHHRNAPQSGEVLLCGLPTPVCFRRLLRTDAEGPDFEFPDQRLPSEEVTQLERCDHEVTVVLQARN